jgi:hypothetical protein
VTVSSATELDQGLVDDNGKHGIEEQTGRRVETLLHRSTPTSSVGCGSRVGQHGPRRDRSGNRLEQLRKASRQGGLRRLRVQIKPDEITSILKSRIEGLEDGGADLSEVGTVLSVATASPASTGSTTSCRRSCSSCRTT